MSLYNNSYRYNILKVSQESILKPKNKRLYLNLVYNNNYNTFGALDNNIRFDKDKYKRMRPIYKKFYEKLINQETNKGSQNSKINGLNNLQLSNNSQNKNIRKNNSFLFDCLKTEKKNIFSELNKLKYKIRLNNRKYSYNKKNIWKSNYFFHSSFEKNENKLYKSGDNFRKAINSDNISRNNIYAINKTNIIINNNIPNLSEDKLTEMNNINKFNHINNTDNDKQYYKKLNNDNIINKEELIKENEKLKKELEYSNNQVEKYKKYRELYLNLMKKVKSNKNMIKNINTNNKDIKNNQYFNNYMNELIDRRKEINNLLKEDEILEKNIKEILSSLED